MGAEWSLPCPACGNPQKPNKNMSGSKTEPSRYQTAKQLTSGALAGAVAKTIIAPLDRTKIIFQTSHSRPFSWVAVKDELVRIVREEGPRRLWKGHSATLARVMPYAAIQFSTFDYIKRHVLPSQTKPQWYELLLAGSGAGAISVICTYPLDLVRAQMAVQRDTHFNAVSMARTIYDKRGISGLYRGLTPTLLGILPYAGVSFSMFETLKKRFHLDEKHNTMQRLACGAFSGFCAQALTYPLDIVRRRQQTEQWNTHHPRKYSGIMSTFRVIVTEEGTRALTKAISMNAVKGPIAVGVSFATHDVIIRYLA